MTNTNISNGKKKKETKKEKRKEKEKAPCISLARQQKTVVFELPQLTHSADTTPSVSYPNFWKAALPKQFYVAKNSLTFKGSLMNSTRGPTRWARPSVQGQTCGNWEMRKGSRTQQICHSENRTGSNRKRIQTRNFKYWLAEHRARSHS